MCGIVAILGRPSRRAVPDPAEIVAGLQSAADAPDLATAIRELERVDRTLRGVPGAQALVGRPDLIASMTARLDQLDARAQQRDAELEAAELGGDALEAAGAELIAFRDVLWAIRRDRLRAAAALEQLAGTDAPSPAVAGYLAIHQALAAIDRLEVRGRDSAGVHVYVWDHGLPDDDAELRAAIDARGCDPLFQSRAVRAPGRAISFVYKAAAEIGELGDNTRALRADIVGDALLRRVLSQPGARVSVLGHTRWASVGIVSEPNCHPLNSEETEGPLDRPYVVAALNGDVDNHDEIRADLRLHYPAPITTDAKVIPAAMARQVANTGGDLAEAFRRTVAGFEGSVAIAAAPADVPEQLYLALRGSGQALYVGLADDLFVVASEPYGVVEETNRYVRMEGESPSRSGEGGRGQVFVLDASKAGEIGGIRRMAYDGTEIPVGDEDVAVAQVTTRDIDRGDAPHFLLKEILESPDSFRKTLRGKIAQRGLLLHASLGERAFPDSIAARLADGSLKRVRVIGQGTALMAGKAMVAMLDTISGGELNVAALAATELSGFGLRLDMSDTLVVAISQSGTTTDTNRTVDLARTRGATVLAIVNRRGTDLTDKADGVLYTSDGRDVEMSVASTKAFYAQVAAGTMLACAITEAAGVGDDARRHQLLTALREMPATMRAVIARRPAIAAAAHRFAPSKRYWAIVGNGPNAVAANEIRIKLSELCYKAIACDVTEDKKHIDLSSEPLILVCAAGLVGGTATDVGKEVAIYNAHKATPIVIATDGDEQYGAAAAVLTVPPIDPALAFVLSVMVGHLWGYEAARAIDLSARPLREAREVIERAVAGASAADDVLEQVRGEIGGPAQRFLDGLRANTYDGHLEASSAVRIMTMLRSALADAPLEAYQRDTGKLAAPGELLDDLTAALTRGIDELTRPIDAIKHQAKTVTVGISRSDEGVLDRPLVQAVLAAGAGRDALSYRSLKVLADLDPAVAAVEGYTRYRIQGDPGEGATIAIESRGGVSLDLASRVDGSSTLVGTKRRVASQREVLVARGRTDGRTLIFVPEVKGGQCTGITLLHVRFHDRLDVASARRVLQGYDHRYDRLVDWVSETEGSMRDELLGELPVADLLINPISEMADHWRG